jgi:hypothetical protein
LKHVFLQGCYNVGFYNQTLPGAEDPPMVLEMWQAPGISQPKDVYIFKNCLNINHNEFFYIRLWNKGIIIILGFVLVTEKPRRTSEG